MTNTQHTPGPWECDDTGHEVYETERMTVISTLPLVRTIADARLIAAAPDLLAAVQFFMTRQAGDLPTYMKPALDKMRAAIAKAEGRA